MRRSTEMGMMRGKIWRSVAVSLLVSCGAIWPLVSGPLSAGEPKSGGGESSAGTVFDPDMEKLAQRGEALIKSAKWRIVEEFDVQNAVTAGGLIVGVNAGEIVAFDAATGQKKWEKASGGTNVFILSSEGDMVITHSTGAAHKVSALALADGSEKWAIDLPNARTQVDVEGSRVTVGVSLAPAYRPMRGPAKPAAREESPAPPELRVYARDTGKLLWTHPLPEGTTESGGYEIETAGDVLYLFTYRRVEGAGVTALNAADGKVRWSYPIPVGTASASAALTEGFVVMDLVPTENAHQKLILLNTADGTVARQIDVEEEMGFNLAMPHSAMLMARPPKLKSFPTFDFMTTRTLTADDVKAKYSLWDLKTGVRKWKTDVFLDEKKYDTTSMNIRQEVYRDEGRMLVCLDGASEERYIWNLTLLDLQTGKALWSNTAENSRPTYLNNVLFYKKLIILHSEEGLLAVDRDDGQRVWYIRGGSMGAWMASDGMLYLRGHESKPGLPTGVIAIPLDGNTEK